MRKYLLFIFLSLTVLIVLVPDVDAMRMVWDLEQIVKRADIIAVGTIESTWVDIRPFDDYKIVDTAKIRVDEWLKNEKEQETIEFRYYGYWAQTLENAMGMHRMDTPIHRYDTGEKVLVHLSYEKPAMVMGEGHYPFFEGKYTIKDNMATSQDGEKTELDSLRRIIDNHLEDKLEEPSKQITTSPKIPMGIGEWTGTVQLENKCKVQVQRATQDYLEQGKEAGISHTVLKIHKEEIQNIPFLLDMLDSNVAGKFTDFDMTTTRVLDYNSQQEFVDKLLDLYKDEKLSEGPAIYEYEGIYFKFGLQVCQGLENGK